VGSNDALRTVFDFRIISIAVVIALIVGAGAGYMVGNSPVSSLTEERDQLEAECDSLNLTVQGLAAELDSTQELLLEEQRAVALLEERYMEMLVIDKENLVLQQGVMDLEAEIDSLQDYIEHIEGEYEELHDAYVEIEKNYDVLQASFESLNQSYADLLSCLDSTVIDSYVQSIEYNFSAGTAKTWEFLIPEYGIIWEATLDFSGDRVCQRHAWRRGEERYFVGSSGITITREESVHYYGYQEHLWGIVKVEYYLSTDDLNKIWILGTITTNLPTIGGSWSTYIDVYDIPKIDGFVEIGEWSPFKNMTLVYQATYHNSIRSELSAWDKQNKAMEISAMINDSNLYVCAVIPDDYLSEDYQIDALYLYLNGEPRTTIRWTTENPYRENLWATYEAVSQYSHTGDGESGADGIYTIEIRYPLGDLEVDEVSIKFAEITKYTDQGFYETSSYWVGAPLYDIFVIGN